LSETYGTTARGTIVAQVVPPPRGATLFNNAAVLSRGNQFAH
jgi:hypothetical protein